MVYMKKLWSDKTASVAMVGAAVAIIVTIFVSILIVYNIAASIDASTLDTDLQAATGNPTTWTPAANATDDTLTQTQTFYTVAPLIVVVLAAVVILGYVTRLGR